MCPRSGQIFLIIKPFIHNYVMKKRLLKSVTYFKSFFKVFYYYNVCQFCFILKKLQGVISYATLDKVIYILKELNLLCILLYWSSHGKDFKYSKSFSKAFNSMIYFAIIHHVREISWCYFLCKFRYNLFYFIIKPFIYTGMEIIL